MKTPHSIVPTNIERIRQLPFLTLTPLLLRNIKPPYWPRDDQGPEEADRDCRY
jgi:hypothetical protein